MNELAEIVSAADPVQAVCITLLVVGCAFALAWVVGVAVKAVMDFFKRLAE